MQVKEILNGGIETVGPEATLQAAAEKMTLVHHGLLPVCAGEQLVGVISEGDIIEACAEGRDPIRSQVREAMTPDAIYCFDDQDVSEAVQMMRAGQVQRLLVMSRRGQLRGVISLADVAAAADDREVAHRAVMGLSEPAEPPPLG